MPAERPPVVRGKDDVSRRRFLRSIDRRFRHDCLISAARHSTRKAATRSSRARRWRERPRSPTRWSQLGFNTFGFTDFYDSSNSQTAKFHNGASLAASAYGGDARFFGDSCGLRAFYNEGSKTTDGYAGEVFFFDNSNAAESTIINHGKTVSVAFSGGIGYFFGNGKAAR